MFSDQTKECVIYMSFACSSVPGFSLRKQEFDLITFVSHSRTETCISNWPQIRSRDYRFTLAHWSLPSFRLCPNVANRPMLHIFYKRYVIILINSPFKVSVQYPTNKTNLRRSAITHLFVIHFPAWNQNFFIPKWSHEICTKTNCHHPAAVSQTCAQEWLACVELSSHWRIF